MLLLNFFVVACSLIVRMLYISFIIFNIIDDFDITILRGYDMFEIFAIAMSLRLIVSKVKPFSENLTNEEIYKLLAIDFVAITITWGMIYIVHLIQL